MEKKPKNLTAIISVAIFALIILAAVFARLGVKLTLDSAPQPSPSPAMTSAVTPPVVSTTPGETATPQPEPQQEEYKNSLNPVDAQGKTLWRITESNGVIALSLDLNRVPAKNRADVESALAENGIAYDAYHRVFITNTNKDMREAYQAVMRAIPESQKIYQSTNEPEPVVILSPAELDKALARLKPDGRTAWTIWGDNTGKATTLDFDIRKMRRDGALEDFKTQLKQNEIEFVVTGDSLIVMDEMQGFEKLHAAIRRADPQAKTVPSLDPEVKN